jgi:hypothetical protein
MSDIAKCTGKDCKVKESCYRFTAPSSDFWQSWLKAIVKDGKCDMYWNKCDMYWVEKITKKKKNESND